jgi:hypothetical protein
MIVHYDEGILHSVEVLLMHVPFRDRIATVAVAVASGFAVAWFADVPGIGSLDIRIATLAVLVIGVGVSASAVVPGFESLIHGSRSYLAATTVLGLAACVAAVVTLLNASDGMLAILVALMLVLWAAATMRHAGGFAPTPSLSGRDRSLRE